MFVSSPQGPSRGLPRPCIELSRIEVTDTNQAASAGKPRQHRVHLVRGAREAATREAPRAAPCSKFGEIWGQRRSAVSRRLHSPAHPSKRHPLVWRGRAGEDWTPRSWRWTEWEGCAWHVSLRVTSCLSPGLSFFFFFFFLGIAGVLVWAAAAGCVDCQSISAWACWCRVHIQACMEPGAGRRLSEFE